MTFVGKPTVTRAIAFHVCVKRTDEAPPIIFEHPPADETYWLVVEDAQGVIVTVDTDFNIDWVGGKERAMKVFAEMVNLADLADADDPRYTVKPYDGAAS